MGCAVARNEPPCPPAPNHDAHDYAERIRERLPGRHQELHEGMNLSMYALRLKCGVLWEKAARVMKGRIVILPLVDFGRPKVCYGGAMWSRQPRL